MSENTEQVIWSLPVTKGFFKQTVVQTRQITNQRVIQDSAYIGLALLDDIVVMNQHRVSDSSYTSVGLRGYSPRFGMGSSKSRTVGDVVFMYKGKPFIIFSQIPDPQGVARLAKAARKRALETIKAEEKMNKARLQEEQRRQRQQQQQKERIRLRTTTTTASSAVITCPRCTTKNTEGSKYCNNCGYRFADAAIEEEGTIINQSPLSQSSSPVSSLPSASPSTIKTIEENSGEFMTYELHAFVKIDYPSKWEIDEHPEPPNFIIFKSPREDPSDILFESVGISSFNIINETPEEIMQGAIIDLERNNPDFTLIESFYTILAGRPAHGVVCDFGGKRYMSIVTIKKDIAYQISYVAEPSKYDIYLPIVQKMVDSFEVMQ